MHPTICYIHGLNSSHRSFAFITQEFRNDHTAHLVNYDSRQRLESSVAEVVSKLPKGPLILIGHSLGGVIAMLIAGRQLCDVVKVVTIGSPLGGSRAAVYARWVASGFPLLGDITPTAPAMREIVGYKPAFPILSIISVGGSLPTSSEPNDSVVSVASQKVLSAAKKIEVKANHFEVLMHEKTVDHIRKFIGAE